MRNRHGPRSCLCNEAFYLSTQAVVYGLQRVLPRNACLAAWQHKRRAALEMRCSMIQCMSLSYMPRPGRVHCMLKHMQTRARIKHTLSYKLEQQIKHRCCPGRKEFRSGAGPQGSMSGQVDGVLRTKKQGYGGQNNAIVLALPHSQDPCKKLGDGRLLASRTSAEVLVMHACAMQAMRIGASAPGELCQFQHVCTPVKQLTKSGSCRLSCQAQHVRPPPA